MGQSLECLRFISRHRPSQHFAALGLDDLKASIYHSEDSCQARRTTIYAYGVLLIVEVLQLNSYHVSFGDKPQVSFS